MPLHVSQLHDPSLHAASIPHASRQSITLLAKRAATYLEEALYRMGPLTTYAPQMSGVVIYLDIDGVVSAMSSRHALGDGRRFELDGFQLTLSRRLGARLYAMDADIRWLSSWGQDATVIGSHMGLPGKRVAARLNDGTAIEDVPEWKRDVVRGQVEREQRPFCWIDDDAISPEFEQWASSLSVPSLLLVPRPNRGMTPADVDAVEAFIAEQTSD